MRARWTIPRLLAGGISRREFHGATVSLDRGIRFVQGTQRVAEIGPDAGVFRSMSGGRAQQRRAFAALAAAVQEDAEELQRVRMLGDGREIFR